MTDRPGRYGSLCLSPDGNRVAIGLRHGDDLRSDVWILGIEQNILQRFTADGTENSDPIWTPDGTRVTFSRSAGGTPDLYWKRADFSDVEAELILHSNHALYPAAWSPDGRTLVFREDVTTDDRNIMLLPFDDQGTPGTPMPFVATEHDETAATLSPDGDWFAYVSNLSGTPEVYVAPFPGPGGRVQVSNAGGVEPLWGPGGREIFYRSGDKMVAVAVETEPAFEVVAREVLFEAGPIRGTLPSRYPTNTRYDIPPDGQRFLMRGTTDEMGSAEQQINIVLNWFEELKERAPTGR